MTTSEFVRKQLRTLTSPHPVGTHVRNHANKNAWIGVVTHVGVTHEGRSLPPMCVDVLILVDRFGVPTKSQLYVAAHSAFFEVVPSSFVVGPLGTVDHGDVMKVNEPDPIKVKSKKTQFYVVMEDEYFRYGSTSTAGDPTTESGVGLVSWCESAEEAYELCTQLNKILNQHRLLHDPQPNQLISK